MKLKDKYYYNKYINYKKLYYLIKGGGAKQDRRNNQWIWTQTGTPGFYSRLEAECLNMLQVKVISHDGFKYIPNWWNGENLNGIIEPSTLIEAIKLVNYDTLIIILSKVLTADDKLGQVTPP